MKPFAMSIIATEAMNDQLDDGQQHNVIVAVRHMAEHLPKDAAIKALRWVYETSTCAECRGFALGDLIDKHDADVTDWIEETQFDANHDVQELGQELRAKQTL
jgi:hypothetical protein